MASTDSNGLTSPTAETYLLETETVVVALLDERLVVKTHRRCPGARSAGLLDTWPGQARRRRGRERMSSS